jgi:hypothetical protein
MEVKPNGDALYLSLFVNFNRPNYGRESFSEATASLPPCRRGESLVEDLQG